ncbi:MAG: hypothetical protein R8G66_26195 [Cytophagales bacterium]|nr:hypothetical protein [Cytophagales bacterium]
MKALVITIVSFLVSFSAAAQWNFGIDVKVYDPVGEFNTNVDGVAGGLSLRGIRMSDNGRWSYGGEIGVAMYSQDQYDVTLPSGTQIEVDEEDCFWTVHGLVQYTLFQNEAIRTYGEGRIGMTTFFSSTIALTENSEFGDEFEFHGTAFNTGLGGGVTLNIGKIFTGERNEFNFDAGVNVHSGSNAVYRDMDAVDTPAPLDAGKFKSLTHYVGYRFGLLVGF